MANPQLRLMILAFPLTSYLIVGWVCLWLIDLSSHLNARLWNWTVGDRQIYHHSLKDHRGLILVFPLAFPILLLLALSSLLWCLLLVCLKITKRQTLLDQVKKLLHEEESLIIALPAEAYHWLQELIAEIFEGIDLFMRQPQPPRSEPVTAGSPEIAQMPPPEPEPISPLQKSMVVPPPYVPNPTILLLSESGIDYTRLRDFLADRHWRQANTETIDILLRVTRRQSEGWLDALNLNDLPCTDLTTLNQLWGQYSGGQFGFSVQSQIYEQVGGDYGQFCDRLGWRKDRQWLQPQDLNYANHAPIGHLPYLGSAIAYSLLIHKLKTCQIT